MAGKFAGGLVRVVGTVTLARLLTPEDFGLISMVAAVTGLLLVFKDLGLSTATIQRSQLTHAQASTLFWLNLLASLALTAITVICAPLIAALYDRAELTLIAIALGLCFPLSGLSAQHLSMLQRTMRYRALAGIQLAASLAAVAIGIIGALRGWHYWALIAMTATSGVVTTTLSWLTVRWTPGRPALDPETRSMIGLGGNLALFRFANHLLRNVDNLLIGWAWGAAALAQYSRAYGVTLQLQQSAQTPVGSVVVASLSRLQAEPERYRQFYLNSLAATCNVLIPVTTLLLLLAKPLVNLVFGDQWSEAATLVQFLGVSMILRPIYNSSGWLYISSGRTKEMRNWGLGASLFIIAGFVAGLPFGTEGVALSFSISLVLLIAPCMRNALEGTGLRLLDITRACAPAYIASAIGTSAACAMPMNTALVATTFVLITAGCLLAHRRSRQTMLDIGSDFLRRGSAHRNPRNQESSPT